MADNFDFGQDDRFGSRPADGAAGLIAVVVGAAIGAVAALLLAPKSGKDLREEIASKAGNWKTHAADAIAEGRERVVSSVEGTLGTAPADDAARVEPTKAE
ncbi:MAG: YtxH domain-containing protein [Capsulimonas sp.]|jgi:gas vesicle protein|uniref:YtxH domain-containing protein n=1 Tax=Capsulimonas sp. TaxID=2494211 RepID=UPI003266D510|nr:YtxH-like protein [Capsulimonas sp.]